MKARKMFEVLDYELVVHDSYMFYHKQFQINEEEPDVCYETDMWHIEFNFMTKSFNKSLGDDNTVANITSDEFKAIQQQIKELGWDDK